MGKLALLGTNSILLLIFLNDLLFQYFIKKEKENNSPKNFQKKAFVKDFYLNRKLIENWTFLTIRNFINDFDVWSVISFLNINPDVNSFLNMSRVSTSRLINF